MRMIRALRQVHGFAVALVLVSLTPLVFTAAPPAFGQPSLPSPSGWPLTGQIRVIRAFDPPDTPWASGHRGVDLTAGVGEPVLAAAPGTVTFAGELAGRGVVVVDHGALRTTYEPVSPLVFVGSRVRQGEVLGVLAAGTHCAARPCLHWGLRAGDRYLDPLELAPAGTEVRLLPAAERTVVEHRAAARMRAARAATVRALASFSHHTGAGRHGFLRPVPGGVTSGFGIRFHPILKVWKLHDGTDFAAGCGAPIRAPYGGHVTRAYFNPAYGNRLMIDHGRVDGRHVVTSYNHANRFLVRVGAHVQRGQLIGYAGATGYATGCHLHLMIWLDGRLSNPLSWW
jgi:murein DD-endopeptidase MepM/ murein hydrolase activator NlpD